MIYKIKLFISTWLYKAFCKINEIDTQKITVYATDERDLEAKKMAEIMTDLIQWTLK